MEDIVIRKAERADVPQILEFIRSLAVYEKMEDQVVADAKLLGESISRFLKAQKKEASVVFLGESLQAIGKIPAGKCVGLSLKPADQVLNIHYDKTDITLPYERLRGFRLEDEVTLAKSGSRINYGCEITIKYLRDAI